MNSREPLVREDGTCAQCGKPRRAERSRQYGKAAAQLDPFCSTECCRVWYGLAIRAGELAPVVATSGVVC